MKYQILKIIHYTVEIMITRVVNWAVWQLEQNPFFVPTQGYFQLSVWTLWDRFSGFSENVSAHFLHAIDKAWPKVYTNMLSSHFWDFHESWHNDVSCNTLSWYNKLRSDISLIVNVINWLFRQNCMIINLVKMHYATKNNLENPKLWTFSLWKSYA